MEHLLARGGPLITISLVDDDPTSALIISEHIKRYGHEKDVLFDVRIFPDGNRFVDDYPSETDIILLDVQMPGMDGFETAHIVRERDEQVPIIFITNLAQHAIRGYEVGAINYLVKPVRYAAFARELDRVLSQITERALEYLTLTFGSTVRRIPLPEVFYIESEGHQMFVHERSGVHVVNRTMKSFEQELASKGFFRSNHGYLVNLAHVVGVDHQSCTLANGATLAVSRPRRRDFLAALAEFVGPRSM